MSKKILYQVVYRNISTINNQDGICLANTFIHIKNIKVHQLDFIETHLNITVSVDIIDRV